MEDFYRLFPGELAEYGELFQISFWQNCMEFPKKVAQRRREFGMALRIIFLFFHILTLHYLIWKTAKTTGGMKKL